MNGKSQMQGGKNWIFAEIDQCKMIATEAREEQKTRVYLNLFAGDDEEEES